MSEYQYYEWQAFDRPLTIEEQQQVKALSSHIDVTSTRALVTYNYGSFGHDETQVLTRYFDAFMYHFEWGIQRLIFRFPENLLETALLEPYLWEYRFELELAGDYLILVMKLYEEERYGRADHDVSLSLLAPIRGDILTGDFRALYLAWLRAAELAGIDEEVEPPVPAGLKDLSAPLEAFLRFFAIDAYLVEAAAQVSPLPESEDETPLEELLSRLPNAERNAFLLRLARGEPHLPLLLNRRLRELADRPPASVGAIPRRTWGELRATAARLRSEAEQRAREAAEARRIQELEALVPRTAQAWRNVDTLIQQKTPRAYDEATELLVKLRDLAIYQGRLPEFQTRLAELQAQYPKRPSLQERLRRVAEVK